MPASAKCVSVTINPDSTIAIEYGDGTGELCHSLEHLREKARFAETTDMAKAFLIGYLLKRSPNLTDVSSVVGKTCTIDLDAGNMVRVQDLG